MKVFRVYSIVDGDILADGQWPKTCETKVGDLVGVLTNLRPVGEGPAWNISIRLSDHSKATTILMPLERFIQQAEYERSTFAPMSFADIESVKAIAKPGVGQLRWAWLFREGIYVIERDPRPSERDAVILQIKALHFQRDETFKRIREQVANFEAVESVLKSGPVRQTIPDDVKLAVWTRDGGTCVRCGASTQLHFDHVIPFARGGSDGVENLQLLCRSCNLAKGSRIV
jgi:hypothetical protein